MTGLSLFIYSWFVVYTFRMISALFGLVYCYDASITEMKFFNSIGEKTEILKPIYNYLPLNQMVFSPNHFDVWTAKGFFKYAINNRLNKEEDVIYSKYLEKFDEYISKRRKEN